MMRPQTDHNKRGHATAAGLGFEPCGPGRYGWQQAKVACTACGHRLPWYHHHHQQIHRDQCRKQGQPIEPGEREEGRYGEEETDGWESACRAFLAERGEA